MTRRIPLRDPISALQRHVTAARRVGIDARCACGENRPEALTGQNKSHICAKCKREKEGKTAMDRHHVAGKANSPTTVPVSVNDHRARLSTEQYDWPARTLENPDGSPLIKAAASIRGFVDTAVFLIEEFLLWIAGMLEALDDHLRERVGAQWWSGTTLEQFAPKGVPHAK